MNKEKVISMIAARLIKLHYDWSRGNISAEKKEIELVELHYIAEKAGVPLCWELHSSVMKNFNSSMASIQWVASGCHLL